MADVERVGQVMTFGARLLLSKLFTALSAKTDLPALHSKALGRLEGAVREGCATTNARSPGRVLLRCS